MVRLTAKDKYGNPICKKEISSTCNAKCSECDYDYECFKKLAYYEDLDEQGLLLKLPCKVNDTIWVVGTKCLSGLYDKECKTSLNETYKCPCHLDDEYIIFPRVVKEHLLIDLIFKKNNNFILGKNVFLTKEEAEKELEKINDGN